MKSWFLNSNVDFIKIRKVTFGISLICIAIIAAKSFLGQLDYGIDFKGGHILELRPKNQNANLLSLRKDIKSYGIKDAIVQNFGDMDYLIKMVDSKGIDMKKVQEFLKKDFTIRRHENIGPKVANDLMKDGIIASIMAIFAMFCYIWIRFNVSFAFCGIIALIHDCIFVFGMYAVFGVEFNITAIVAILITAGYSINDTIVIYDRVRAVLRASDEKASLKDIINMSINKTLSRTFLTSLSTIIALLSLYFFGGQVVSSYTAPIILGVIAGTYSSIFLAAPMLLYVRDLAHDNEKSISV